MNGSQTPEVAWPRTKAGFRVCVGFGCGLIAVWAVMTYWYCGPCTCGHSSQSSVEAKLREFAAKLETYRMVSGDYPTQEQGLMALVEWPEQEPVPERWKAQFKVLPRDPWGNEYRYFCPGRGNPEHWEVVSAGVDGVFGTADDVSSEELE